MAKKNEDLVGEIDGLIFDLEKEIDNLLAENEKLHKDNLHLKGEIDSLWMMMDEMTKQDIESWSQVLEELNLDVASRALMVSKKKVDC